MPANSAPNSSRAASLWRPRRIRKQARYAYGQGGGRRLLAVGTGQRMQLVFVNGRSDRWQVEDLVPTEPGVVAGQRLLTVLAGIGFADEDGRHFLDGEQRP